MFNIFVGPVLKPKETHSLYTLLLAFYWLGGDFCLFIFIWEVRIRHWSRNLSQKFYRDVLMKRNPNWCIVAFWWSEIQIDVSSHFDEAKSKSMYRRILMKRNLNRCIVAFWWSEIQIDRRIEIERNSSRSSHCDWAKYTSMYHRILMAFIFREVGVPWIVMNLVERRWVCRISLLLRAKTSMSSLASRAKMSMSNLAFFLNITSFVVVMNALLTGFVFIWSALLLGGHFPSEQILLFHWLINEFCCVIIGWFFTHCLSCVHPLFSGLSHFLGVHSYSNCWSSC